MEFINKKHQAIFYPEYIKFETHKWNISAHNYTKYNYSGFSINFKNTIKGLLIDEQNSLCCYCLKELEKNDSSTIEHLYPNNPQSHNIFSNYKVKCTEKIHFDVMTRHIPTSSLDNLPHDISYYNLLACCKLCNNTRDTKEIRPFVFEVNVKKEFSYNDNGYIFSIKYQDEITKIGLANDQYVNYRKLWRHMRKNYDNTIFLNRNRLERALKKVALELFNKTGIILYAELLSNGLKLKDAIAYRYFYN
ncbi:HNH endonuclease family protein [Chryseobacterium luteum]|uniref:HNH domain-containing protein n=1 Tax=Chryseobacterium luteum TaxID=421531 RepID=A0A085YXT3_9FLAO|nr:hypothetical protein [Chryseobacterium luteum]KFE96996.1 hypothetical protein IX38_22090 [Chryseobacterium luteum]